MIDVRFAEEEFWNLVSGFQCENNDLIMMKDHPYFAAVKKKVDRNMVAELFTQGSVDLLNCKSKKGKSFNVKVMLEEAEDGSIVHIMVM